MAAAYLKVWFGDQLLRTFGGNGRDVREEQERYKDLAYVQRKHPQLTPKQCRKVKVTYSNS